jgi:hypothetical protein
MTRETLQSLANRLGEARREVRPGDHYRHYGNNEVYEVVEIGALEEDGKTMVVFRPTSYDDVTICLGQTPIKTVLHIRPLDEFTGHTYDSAPGGVELKKRFTRVERREQWVEAR